MNVPYTKEKQRYIKQAAAGLQEEQPPTGRPFSPSHYVLKPDMMAKMGYPLPDHLEDGELRLPEGFVMTQPGKPGCQQ